MSRNKSIETQSRLVFASDRGVEKKWGVTINEYKVCLVGEENTLKLVVIMA